MKDRFLSALSNERKFAEVGANSIVSSAAWRAFTRECENERADSDSRTHFARKFHAGNRARNADVCAEGGATYFPPFRLRAI